MAEIEQTGARIVLVNESGATELKPTNRSGQRLFRTALDILAIGINDRLISATPFALETSEATVAPAIVTPEHTLELSKAAYKAKPYNPELLSEFNQAFWNARKQVLGVPASALEVHQIPYTEEQINSRFVRGNFGLFVPQIVSTVPEGQILLGKGFPEMGGWAFQEGAFVRNVDRKGNPVELYGWMFTEREIDAPLTGTNENKAYELVEKNNRIGDTLNVYAIAGQQSKVLEGQYLDEVRTSIRVLSSRFEGQVLNAHFHPRGDLHVGWYLRPDDVPDHLGARSLEVVKA